MVALQALSLPMRRLSRHASPLTIPSSDKASRSIPHSSQAHLGHVHEAADKLESAGEALEGESSAKPIRKPNGNLGKIKKIRLKDPTTNYLEPLKQNPNESNEKFRRRKEDYENHKKYWYNVKSEAMYGIEPDQKEEVYQKVLREKRNQKNSNRRNFYWSIAKKVDIPRMSSEDAERLSKMVPYKLYRKRRDVRAKLKMSPGDEEALKEAEFLGLDSKTLRVKSRSKKPVPYSTNSPITEHTEASTSSFPDREHSQDHMLQGTMSSAEGLQNEQMPDTNHQARERLTIDLNVPYMQGANSPPAEGRWLSW